MNEVVQRAAEAGARIAELQKQRAEHLKSADSLEQKAREERRAAQSCKEQIGEWSAALSAFETQKRVQAEEEAAKQATARAAAHEQAMADKLKELDEAIAAAKTKKTE